MYTFEPFSERGSNRKYSAKQFKHMRAVNKVATTDMNQLWMPQCSWKKRTVRNSERLFCTTTQTTIKFAAQKLLPCPQRESYYFLVSSKSKYWIWANDITGDLHCYLPHSEESVELPNVLGLIGPAPGDMIWWNTSQNLKAFEGHRECWAYW